MYVQILRSQVTRVFKEVLNLVRLFDFLIFKEVGTLLFFHVVVRVDLRRVVENLTRMHNLPIIY